MFWKRNKQQPSGERLTDYMLRNADLVDNFVALMEAEGKSVEGQIEELLWIAALYDDAPALADAFKARAEALGKSGGEK